MNTTWTERMIAELTEKAEHYWQRMCTARRNGNQKAASFHETAYNRRMFAVAYLRTRLQGE